MTIVGEAFIAISPEGAQFASKLESQLKGAGLGSVFQDLAGPAAALAIVAGLGAIGNQFDKVTKQIHNETGATGQELTGLADDVTAAFRKVPVSLGDAATAVDELFRRGVPLGPQLENLAQQELFLAKITKEQLGATVESTTGLMQKFNVPLQDQSRELDVLFRAYQASGQSLGTLTGNLQSGGAVLQQFGFNLDQSASLIALLEKSAVNVGPALAGLRIAFAKIVSEGGSPQETLKNLIAEFQAGKDPAKAMADAIQLFGKRSGSELAVAISKGKFQVDALLKEITDGRDGIIATGLATLTLGDQFKLLRNNVQADLASLGTEVLHDLESGLQSTAVPLETLITGVAHFAVVLAPAAEGVGALLLPLKLTLPVVKDLGVGLDGISLVLGHLPGPAIAVAGAVGVGVLAWKAYKDATLAALITTEAFDKVVEFAGSPLGIFLLSVTALGAALSAFSQRNADVVAAANQITKGIFQSDSATNLFTGDVSTATRALDDFLASQAKSGQLSSGLAKGLSDSGKTTSQLGAAITGTDSSFKSFRDSVVQSVQAQQKYAQETGTLGLQAGGTLQALNAERDGFKKSATQKLENLVTTGQLTAAQERQIVTTNTSKDGEVNYAGALNDANIQLAARVEKHNAVVSAATKTQTSEAALTEEIRKGAITDDQAKTALQSLGFQGDEVGAQLAKLKAHADELNQAQDLQAQKLVPLTARYHDLATAIGVGNITEDEAEKLLVRMGFSAAGAKAQFSALQSQIQQFVSTAVSKIPDAGQVISDMNSAATSDSSKLQSDLNERASLQSQLTGQLTKNAASTQKALSDVNSKIALDQQQIESGQTKTTKTLENDQRRRDQILSNATHSGGAASASLAQQIHKNDADIVADQHKLASDTSLDTFTKKLIDNAVQVAQFQSNLQKLVSEGLGGLAGVLAEQGPQAAAALAAGFASNRGKASVANAAVQLGQETTNKYSDFLKKNNSVLDLATAQLGSTIGKGMADGLTKELLKEFPELKQLGIGIGGQVGTAVTPAVSAALDTITLRHILNQHGEAEAAGKDYDDGIAKGITDNTISITKAVNKMSDGAISTARHDFRSNSPSLEGVAIGSDFVAGIGIGISSSDLATSATSKLVDAVTAAAASSFSTPAFASALVDATSSSFSGVNLGEQFIHGIGVGMTNGQSELVKTAGDLASRVTQQSTAMFIDGWTQSFLGGFGKVTTIVKKQKLFPNTPFTTPTPHPSLIGASLQLNDVTPTTREDALAQQSAANGGQGPLTGAIANPPHGPFDGATLIFPEHADPLHIAADLDWLQHHGIG